jgi:hypothetical protein
MPDDFGAGPGAKVAYSACARLDRLAVNGS